jgi:serine/threonine protein kinase
MNINSKYEILEKVGSGNFSTVYTARNHHTQQTTALKVMKTHQNIAVKEAYLLKSFEHPNIVKVYDFEQDKTSG